MLLVLLASGTASAQDFTGRMVFSDGDSLRVSGARVRLFGIDAPEMDQTCTRQDGRNWQCGKWAARQARALFDRQHADCLYRDTDRYGRIVATCRVDGQDIAAVLVNLGIATAINDFRSIMSRRKRRPRLRAAASGRARWWPRKSGAAASGRRPTSAPPRMAVLSRAIFRRTARSITCPVNKITRTHALLRPGASAGSALRPRRKRPAGAGRGDREVCF